MTVFDTTHRIHVWSKFTYIYRNKNNQMYVDIPVPWILLGPGSEDP